VAPLHGAVALEEVHHVAVAVGQDLDLHVARVDHEPARRRALAEFDVNTWNAQQSRLTQQAFDDPDLLRGRLRGVFLLEGHAEVEAVAFCNGTRWAESTGSHFSANMRPSPKDAFASLLALANASSSSSSAAAQQSSSVLVIHTVRTAPTGKRTAFKAELLRCRPQPHQSQNLAEAALRWLPC